MPATAMTLDDLTTILKTCAGDEDLLVSGDELASSTFTVLGYDSLALLEASAEIKRKYGVVVDDGALADLETPQDLLDHVNAAVAA
jgi:act minimal PKS acyl carrier protein